MTTSTRSTATDTIVDGLVRDICRQLGYDPSRPPVHVNDHQAAEALGATTGTLCTWRSTGRYNIPFVKVGRKVRYPIRGLAEFMARRTYGHTQAAA